MLNDNDTPTYFKINENCAIKVIENKNKIEITFDDVKMNKQLDEMMNIITWYFTTIDKAKQSNINGNCLLEIQTESIYTKYQKYIKCYLNNTIKNDISLISINLLKLIQKNKGEQNELDVNEISEKLNKKDCLITINKLLQLNNNKALFFVFLINSKLKTKIQFNFQFIYTLIDISSTSSLKPTFNNSDSHYQLLTHKTDIKELGGLFQIKEKLNFYIKLYQHPQTIITLSPFNKYLITGPANSGKSLLAKGFADMFELPIILVNCANLFSNQFSETESNLKELFHFKDKLNSKYVIILEDIELISIKRGSSEDQFSDLQNRILTCLLNELDGLNENLNFILIATTNHLNKIDNALLRPGNII
ncbi:P-loop containing nucleoside triphosphate hydrolase protein [Neoconidiobolus thromboides FSU 785]|nr:P-loop containing nucleoside triphosphate hydrolase protein [Neoconidiobolus thromboides FSU 785]